MKLTYEQIKSAAFGVVATEEKQDGIHFYRFRPDQEAHYKENKPDFQLKTFATAGVRLSFTTDSPFLEVEYLVESSGSSRKFAYFDVLEDGVLVGHFGVEEKPSALLNEKIALSSKEKKVELYFPWSACVVLKSVGLSEGASFAPYKRGKTMLSYGDSITHGYDAIYPSQAYAAKLASLLDADSINRGIGGEIFRPELLAKKEDFEPDFITVAYGTNDWAGGITMETFRERCRLFYETLSKQYPKAKIYAISPIWRKDLDQEKAMGIPHWELESLMREILADLPNVRVIGGYPLTPHLSEFFSDLYLHPNDMGFLHYAQNLYEAIKNEG